MSSLAATVKRLPGRLLLSIFVASLVLLPAGASAAAPGFTSCGRTPGLQCTELSVPLDRTGQTPGTLTLHVERLPAAGAERGVAFLLAGGPGQGSARAFDLGAADHAELFRYLLPDYTLVAFDNRGTGGSGVLRCPGLQAATSVSVDVAAGLAADCASAIGSQRQFYSTADHAEDIEAVRAALGVDKIALFGVSYGTKLALAYALAHPDHVQRLLLDSTLPTALPDPFGTNVLRALPATLAGFCAGGLCRGVTPNYAGDVVALANRLEATPVQGKVVQPNGTLKTERLNGEDLLATVIESDLNPGLGIELPAAVHAARGGDPRALLRLFELANRSSVQTAEELSAGVYAATTCDDGLFPWAPDSPVGDRAASIQAAVSALPVGSLGPFGTWAERIGTAELCQLWPSPAGGAPLGVGPLPDVPVLVVGGGLDMRTPLAGAAAVAAMFPQGHVLAVPGVGHSVLLADASGCSQAAVRNWAVGGSVPASCPRVAPFERPIGAPPAAPARRLGPAASLGVAVKTIHEAEAAWLTSLGSSTGIVVAGLSGGRLAPTASGLGFTLARYRLTAGVELTGKLEFTPGAGLPLEFHGTVTVAGPFAVPGKLTVSGLATTGTLGGSAVRG
jgi:pimeloyl-ACP methyl ester carboxylesterase